MKYGKPGGYVKLSAKKEDDGMRIVVEDDVIRINKEDLSNIFD